MKVIYAVISSNKQVFHPGFNGALKQTLNEKSYKGIEMELIDQGVKISFKNRVLVVPLHQFEFVELENASKKASK